MANFQASFTKQFTNNCQTLTVTDTSNYGFDVNIEHRVKEDFNPREVTLRDISGNILAVKNIVSGDTVSFDISLLSFSQLYLDIALRLQGVGFGYEIRVGGLLPCII